MLFFRIPTKTNAVSQDPVVLVTSYENSRAKFGESKSFESALSIHGEVKGRDSVELSFEVFVVVVVVVVVSSCHCVDKTRKRALPRILNVQRHQRKP